ncbi:peptidase S58 DmpA [Altericroceibacterium spongiae]|uniref:Peptidase S58 DmpA n=2 Tax=Altericroceibacterium spongiae TaxID=2320269 RepID=A0A420EFK4_9SPHN|nr:peptidase S58 DmpA [Altericroceibacterium spongiae]
MAPLEAQESASPAPQPTIDQSTLTPRINVKGERELNFDWPMLKIGTGEYEEGPTGVTVFRFGRKVAGAVDVRGGAPGTVNSDFLNLGYQTPDLDAVVLSGGSWYGLESVTAVDSALKDDGERSGYWNNIGLSVGSIIYDFGDRRLNEIYPDKKLAQAAVRAAQPGLFPLGPHGAGSSAQTGGLFGCNAHSGQGGAFRQVGDVKIAAFTIVNALGVVVDRDGQVVACNKDSGWPEALKATDLVNGLPGSRKPGWTGVDKNGMRKNTTVSLVVTNVKMTPAELKRLAVQVHTSMARGIQPFSTAFDGDVLWAVSTAEVDPLEPGFASVDIATIAGEAMWDAILSSVPEQPFNQAVEGKPRKLSTADLKALAGEYRFSPIASLRISEEGGKLYGEATDRRAIFAIPAGEKRELVPDARGFVVPGRYPMRLTFASDGTLVINPGPWEQRAMRNASQGN